jgi:hypothetical protein
MTAKSGENRQLLFIGCGMAETHSLRARQSCRAVHLGEYLGVHVLVGVALGMASEALTVGIVVTAEPDHHQAFFFREDGLVDMPCCLQVREDD